MIDSASVGMNPQMGNMQSLLPMSPAMRAYGHPFPSGTTNGINAPMPQHSGFFGKIQNAMMNPNMIQFLQQLAARPPGGMVGFNHGSMGGGRMIDHPMMGGNPQGNAFGFFHNKIFGGNQPTMGNFMNREHNMNTGGNFPTRIPTNNYPQIANLRRG